MLSTGALSILPRNLLAYVERDSTYRACPSAKIVSKAREVFPEPLTPVITVNWCFGISTFTWRRLFLLAPRTTRSLSFLSLLNPFIAEGSFTSSTLEDSSFNCFSKNGLRNPPVKVFLSANSSGVPWPTNLPPNFPPPGPNSMTWSAKRKTSRLCSMTNTLLPCSTKRSRVCSSVRMSWKWRPVVGSSSKYSVRPVDFFRNSEANFTRWASPPLRVVEGCPSLTYPKPTSSRVWRMWRIFGWFSKSSAASVIVSSRISKIVLCLYRICRVSALNRFPSQVSQGIWTSLKNCISMVFSPAPLQSSHRPPLTLKENRPLLYPRILDSGSMVKRSRIKSKTLV